MSYTNIGTELDSDLRRLNAIHHPISSQNQPLHTGRLYALNVLPSPIKPTPVPCRRPELCMSAI